MFAALVLTLVAATAACGSSGSHTASSTVASTTTSPTVAPTTTTRVGATSVPSTPTTRPAPPPTTRPVTGPCAPPVGGSVVPQSSPAPSDVMLLTSVGVATRGCTDTISFALDSTSSQKPGYTVAYQRGPFTQDASGKPISIQGNAFLVVTLQNATGFDFNTNRHTYVGPLRFQPPNTAYVQDVVETGDFEAVTTWVIGVRDEVPFSVQATGAPRHTLRVALGE